jgi:hypothetical protein
MIFTFAGSTVLFSAAPRVLGVTATKRIVVISFDIGIRLFRFFVAFVQFELGVFIWLFTRLRF